MSGRTGLPAPLEQRSGIVLGVGGKMPAAGSTHRIYTSDKRNGCGNAMVAFKFRGVQYTTSSRVYHDDPKPWRLSSQPL